MTKQIQSKAGCFVIIFIFSLILVLFSYFRDDIEKYKTRNSEVVGIAWYDAMDICKAKFISVSEYGGIVPNCRKRKENATEYIFTWNRSVPILLKDKSNKKTRNSGTCIVNRNTGAIDYLSINNQVFLDRRK